MVTYTGLSGNVAFKVLTSVSPANRGQGIFSASQHLASIMCINSLIFDCSNSARSKACGPARGS